MEAFITICLKDSKDGFAKLLINLLRCRPLLCFQRQHISNADHVNEPREHSV
jgi:hypothetical protein